MTKAEAIKKVLKCLRLSKSSNPHEAAAALRQARALMAQYGITADAAIAQEFESVESKPCARGSAAPASLCMLLNLVARGFRCDAIWTAGFKSQVCMRVYMKAAFVGRGADPTVAAYAFDVLRLQMDRDRRAHLTRVRKRANREARGEAFAQGWVLAVAALFPAAECSEEDARALAVAKKALFPDLEQHECREMGRGGRSGSNDWSAGVSAGRKARLHAGVTGDGQRRLAAP